MYIKCVTPKGILFEHDMKCDTFKRYLLIVKDLEWDQFAIKMSFTLWGGNL